MKKKFDLDLMKGLEANSHFDVLGREGKRDYLC